MKPFLKWPGSKYDEIDDFKKYIPKSFQTYVEPFLGGGSVFFHLYEQAKQNIINDAHEELISLYNQIKIGNSEEIVQKCKETGNTEEAYYYMRDKFVADGELEKAFKFYYRSKLCFRGMTRYNSSGKFNIPYGKYKTVNFDTIALPKYKAALKNTIIRCGSFESVMKEFDSPDTFVFLDPPDDSEFKNYYLDFGKEEHKKLADIFHQSKSMILLIIAETPFIRSLYKDDIISEYEKSYRFRIRQGRVKQDQLNKIHLVIGKNLTIPKIQPNLTVETFSPT